MNSSKKDHFYIAARIWRFDNHFFRFRAERGQEKFVKTLGGGNLSLDGFATISYLPKSVAHLDCTLIKNRTIWHRFDSRFLSFKTYKFQDSSFLSKCYSAVRTQSQLSVLVLIISVFSALSKIVNKSRLELLDTDQLSNWSHTIFWAIFSRQWQFSLEPSITLLWNSVSVF